MHYSTVKNRVVCIQAQLSKWNRAEEAIRLTKTFLWLQSWILKIDYFHFIAPCNVGTVTTAKPYRSTQTSSNPALFKQVIYVLRSE